MNDSLQTDNEKKKFNWKKELVGTIIYIFFVIVIIYLIITYVGQRTEVSGTSMENTLHNKDNLILDKITYRFSEPKRFDIIVFPYEGDHSTLYIKRIIGLPGDVVQIMGGEVYINDELLETDVYGKEIMEDPGEASDPIALGKGQYFVLGDNRNNSSDSRFNDVGLIKRKDILGKAFLRIWPLKDFGILKHQ